MAFTVFQRVVAGEPPTRARHPTERSREVFQRVVAGQLVLSFRL